MYAKKSVGASLSRDLLIFRSLRASAATTGNVLFAGDVASSNSATATGGRVRQKTVGADELCEAAMGCAATLNGGPAARIAAFVPRQRLQGLRCLRET